MSAAPRAIPTGEALVGQGDAVSGPDPAARLMVLLQRMRTGDRLAAAEFIIENAELIRRRFRKRISRSVRQLYDSQDLVSTLARRLDTIVQRGRLEAGSVGELWSLVMVLATYSLNEHAGKALRHRDFREPDLAAPPEAEAAGEPGPSERHALLVECLRRLEGSVDATILMLRLAGQSHTHIAEHVGLSVEATRKRWERIRGTIRVLEGGR